ncbi:hypothetical protein M8C21_007546 [Ambrosia artemisiifolia]|uniref:Uncharacterized protein n=1 Tax=Ambrosia artemisiifolia TaxID=4212 RepID=A0AAD5GFH9_AMBAR|nr:hypothetical protein M8C21_007546 [Ambrosia artemisiifolia]
MLKETMQKLVVENESSHEKGSQETNIICWSYALNFDDGTYHHHHEDNHHQHHHVVEHYKITKLPLEKQQESLVLSTTTTTTTWVVRLFEPGLTAIIRILQWVLSHDPTD